MRPFKSIAYAGPRAGTRAHRHRRGARQRDLRHAGDPARRRASSTAGALRSHAAGVTFVPSPIRSPTPARAARGDRNLNRNLGPTDTPRDFEDHVANWLCPLLARQRRPARPAFVHAGETQAFAIARPATTTTARSSRSRKRRAEQRPGGAPGRDARGRRLARHLRSRRLRRRIAARHRHKLDLDPRYGVGTTEYMRSVGGYAMTLECGQHDDPQRPRSPIAPSATRSRFSAPSRPPTRRPRRPIRGAAAGRRDRPDACRRHVRARVASFDPVTTGDLIGTRHDGTAVTAPSRGRSSFPNPGAEAGHEWFYLARPSLRFAVTR